MLLRITHSPPLLSPGGGLEAPSTAAPFLIFDLFSGPGVQEDSQKRIDLAPGHYMEHDKSVRGIHIRMFVGAYRSAAEVNSSGYKKREEPLLFNNSEGSAALASRYSDVISTSFRRVPGGGGRGWVRPIHQLLQTAVSPTLMSPTLMRGVERYSK